MKYLSILEDVPLFNSESYVSQRDKGHKDFCTEFCQTQIFRNFLQCEGREEFNYFKNIVSDLTSQKESRNHKRSNSISAKRTSTLSPGREIKTEFSETFIILPYCIENNKNDLQRAISILNDKYINNGLNGKNIFNFGKKCICFC